MGPQIRLIQSNDTMMAEKIQTTIVNTIPLWKNQMVLALGIAHSQQAMQAERAVTDATNELLKKNAATLKAGQRLKLQRNVSNVVKPTDYLTVTALTQYLKAKFERDPYLDRVYLTGEISNFRLRPNAHQYFS